MIIIVEGSDRTGKDTLIDNLKYFYMFPTAIEIKSSKLKNLSGDSPLYFKYAVEYYRQWFNTMYNIANSSANYDSTFIFNRGHLSEFVYAQLYRNYSADFVFSLEKSFMTHIMNLHKVYLITLTDNPHSLLLRDDGLSASKNGIRDVKKEQELFIEAHNKSVIKFKQLIDIRNKTTEDVFSIVVNLIDKDL